MQWMELILKTQPEDLNRLCGLLDEDGSFQYMIEDSRDFQEFVDENRQFWGMVDAGLAEHYADICQIKIYVENDALLSQKIEKLTALTGIDPEQNLLPEQNWDDAWKENYDVEPVGCRLEIVPHWLEPSGERIPIILDPGLTFGTGYHPTTRMCLSVLEQLAVEGKTVLDIGCGSGILSIGALRLGASAVTGCDIDESSPKAAMENAAFNGYDESRFRVYLGDILRDKRMKKQIEGTYDLVLANMVADVVIPLAPVFSEYMGPDSSLLVSGIVAERADEVRASLERSGLIIKEHLSEEEWNTYLCRVQ